MRNRIFIAILTGILFVPVYVTAGNTPIHSLCDKEWSVINKNGDNSAELIDESPACEFLKTLRVVTHVSYSGVFSDEVRNSVDQDRLFKLIGARPVVGVMARESIDRINSFTESYLLNLSGLSLEKPEKKIGRLPFPDYSERLISVSMVIYPVISEDEEADKVFCFVSIEAVPCKECAGHLMLHDYKPIEFSFFYKNINGFIDGYSSALSEHVTEGMVKERFFGN